MIAGSVNRKILLAVRETISKGILGQCYWNEFTCLEKLT